MSDQEYDKFADIVNSNAGIFGEDTSAMEQGLAKFDSARTIVQQDGVCIEMSCRGCGRGVKLTVEWPELVAFEYSVAPQVAFRGQPNILQNPVQWAYSTQHQAWWPNYPCNICRTPCAPLITPEEAKEHLQKGRRNGWIDPRGEQHVRNICAAAAQAAQGQQLAMQSQQGFGRR